MIATQPATEACETEWVDGYNRLVQQLCLLPNGSTPREARCKGCSHYLGGLVNDKAIVFASFNQQDNQWSRLSGASRFDRSVTITCTKCGRKNPFHFDHKD